MAGPEGPSRHDETVGEAIGRKAERKLEAQGARHRGVWFGLGMFGLVGWSIAVPTLLGTALGVWLDGHYPQRFSWTLTLLITGLTAGCFNAWFWVDRESKEIQKDLDENDE